MPPPPLRLRSRLILPLLAAAALGAAGVIYAEYVLSALLVDAAERQALRAAEIAGFVLATATGAAYTLRARSQWAKATRPQPDRPSIRALLFGLISIPLLALFGLIGYALHLGIENEVDKATRSAARLAQITATDTASFLGASAQMLRQRWSGPWTRRAATRRLPRRASSIRASPTWSRWTPKPGSCAA